MRAIQVREYVKGPLDLTVTTLPIPSPSPDQYLIQVHSAGTNFFDLLQIQGKYQNQPPLPWISGASLRAQSSVPLAATNLRNTKLVIASLAPAKAHMLHT
ncbi:hypothetical protein CISG_07552 [Coccidioides immitis RMSCC 3703]|uniref:Quinone oxidoreductase n=1 Tax=Coccidioides immitis RMSCC 3703 TaxID=454286 RepID=A0A0J8R213_COCIT|nr:hypothetical protein CISG_07552 [Coccidioides immitis RMSCC 3703]